MKHCLLFLVVLFGTSSLASAQVSGAADVGKRAKTQITRAELTQLLIDSLRRRGQDPVLPEQAQIATLSLRSDTVQVYRYISKEEPRDLHQKVRADKTLLFVPIENRKMVLTDMRFIAENGRLMRVYANGKVTGGNGNMKAHADAQFTNVRTSIQLNRTPRRDDFLALDGGNNENEYVRYKDLVLMTHLNGRSYIPDDGSWTLSPIGKKSKTLTTGGNLNNLLEVALFTDLLATLNQEDNGLVTTEIASNLMLNTSPINQNGPLFPATVIRPYFALARLDSRFDTLQLNANDRIDRPNLLQRSYLRFGANLNMLTWDNRGPVTFHLNISWTRTLTRVGGPTGGPFANRTTNVYQNLYGVELLATVRRQGNFGGELYLAVLRHNVQSQQRVSNTQSMKAFRPGALFYYHPFGSPNNKLFLRLSNFVFPKSRQRDFVQLQVGYSIGLSGLLANPDGNAHVSTRPAPSL
jgi:hypothetical protein